MNGLPKLEPRRIYRLEKSNSHWNANYKKASVKDADDEPLIRDGLCRFLEKDSFVMTVGSAEEALEEIQMQHYDLCFLDVILPGMNGLEAMKIIKELSPNTKVAIMSGSYLG